MVGTVGHGFSSTERGTMMLKDDPRPRRLERPGRYLCWDPMEPSCLVSREADRDAFVCPDTGVVRGLAGATNLSCPCWLRRAPRGARCSIRARSPFTESTAGLDTASHARLHVHPYAPCHRASGSIAWRRACTRLDRGELHKPIGCRRCRPAYHLCNGRLRERC